VSLKHAGHLGRLTDIVEPLARQGYVAIGFVNAHGGHQIMVPWGGSKPRLAPNPIAFGFPSEAEPIVIDMSTSAQAAGMVRLRMLDGLPLDPTAVVDAAWQPVVDPENFYRRPPQAFLAPLGATVGYKGFALAIATEIMAGILTGAGFAREDAEDKGNAGLFIAMRSDVFGCDSELIRQRVSELAAYIESTPAAPGYPSIRMPGSSKRTQKSTGDTIDIPEQVWRTIERLARRRG
jgi:uncharacterized oxidoreductase